MDDFLTSFKTLGGRGKSSQHIFVVLHVVLAKDHGVFEKFIKYFLLINKNIIFVYIHVVKCFKIIQHFMVKLFVFYKTIINLHIKKYLQITTN